MGKGNILYFILAAALLKIRVFWGLLPCTGGIFPYVSKDCNAFIFGLKNYKKKKNFSLDCFDDSELRVL